MSIGRLAEPCFVGHGQARIAEQCSWGTFRESCSPLQGDKRVNVISLEDAPGSSIRMPARDTLMQAADPRHDSGYDGPLISEATIPGKVIRLCQVSKAAVTLTFLHDFISQQNKPMMQHADSRSGCFVAQYNTADPSLR
jgi:hypothetical protein